LIRIIKDFFEEINKSSVLLEKSAKEIKDLNELNEIYRKNEEKFIEEMHDHEENEEKFMNQVLISPL